MIDEVAKQIGDGGGDGADGKHFKAAHNEVALEDVGTK